MRLLLLSLLLFLLLGCNAPVSPVAQPATIPTVIATATSVVLPPAPAITLLAENEARPPIGLEFPTLKRIVSVEAMAWQVTTLNGERTADWQVPLDAAGWHPNSAKPGSAGTVLISGHHRMGSAVFAPIAQGGVQQGQDIIVEDAANRRWIYRVVTVLKPILVEGATAEEKSQLESVLTATDQPRLVLLTGWPEFSDTHYVAVVAELIG